MALYKLRQAGFEIRYLGRERTTGGFESSYGHYNPATLAWDHCIRDMQIMGFNTFCQTVLLHVPR
jgi:hypothetical protein